MVTISILANTVRPSGDRRSDDTAFGAGTFSWQDPVHSWKAGPGEVMTVENLFDFYRAMWIVFHTNLKVCTEVQSFLPNQFAGVILIFEIFNFINKIFVFP